MTILNFDAFWRDHGVARGLTETGTKAKEAETHVNRLGHAGGTLVGAFAGFAAAEIFHSFIESARESEMQGRITEARIKSTGGAAHVTAADVDELAHSIGEKVGVDHSAIQSGENMLLTFTNIRNETGKGNDIFDQATQATTDLAASMNHGAVNADGMQHASILLGKALNDPLKGLTALTRVGVSFTAQQKEQIRALVASGHTLEAQKIIIGEVNREFGGTAAAAADPLQRIGVILKDVGETVGKHVLPAMSKVADVMAATPGPVYLAVGGFVALGAGAIVVAKAIEAVKTVSETTAVVMRALGLSTAQAATAEAAEAAAADGAAASTAAAGDAAAAAGAKFGTLAGRLGLAGVVVGLGAASAEVTAWAGRTDVADVSTGALASSLLDLQKTGHASGAALDLASLGSTRLSVTAGDASDAMQRFGDEAHGAFSMGLTDIIGRAQSGAERVERFTKTAGELDDALAQLAGSGHGQEAAALFDQLKKATGLSGDELQHVINRFPKYQAAVAAANGSTQQEISAEGQATAAHKVHYTSLKTLLGAYPKYKDTVLAAVHATDSADTSTTMLTDAQVKAAKAAVAQKKAIDGLTNSLSASNNATLKTMGAEDAYWAAVDDATKAIKNNKHTLDVHTAAGRTNRGVLEQLASTSLQYLGTINLNTDGGKRFQSVLKGQWQRLYDANLAFTGSKKKARAYADEILAVPKTLALKVTAPNLGAVRGQVKGLGTDILHVQSHKVTVTVNAAGNVIGFTQNGKKGQAAGGYITGPGTATSDSIPTYLSNGEFVINAAATSRHRQLLDAINSGKGYATGGLVGRQLTVQGASHFPAAGSVTRAIDADVVRALTAGGGLGGGGGGGGPMPKGSGVARWALMMGNALNRMGLPHSLLPNELRQIATESGGNPNAVQGNIGDVNNRSGDLAKGLLQIIGATYRAYHVPGTAWNVFDPWSNMLASLNYQKHRYGNRIASVIGHGHGYAGGTRYAAPGWRWVGEYGKELVKFRGGEQVLSNRASLGAGAGGGVTRVEIDVHLDGTLTGLEDRVFGAIERGARRGRLDRIVRMVA